MDKDWKALTEEEEIAYFKTELVGISPQSYSLEEKKQICEDMGRSSAAIEDEFFRGRDWGDFESFKADLEAYIVHWNTRRRQVKLKGLTPEEFRNQPFAA